MGICPAMTPFLRTCASCARQNSLAPIVLSLGAIFLLGLFLGADAAGDYRATPAYKALLKLNRDVKSSISDIEVRTKTKSFPPVSITLRGHSYFKAPDQQAVVFDNVPGLLKGMVKDSPSIAPARLWPTHYSVSFQSNGDGTTTFHLTARSAADPIASADVTVDNRTGYMNAIAFANRNGSTVSNSLTYQRFGKRAFVVSQQGTATGKGYKADVTTTFSNYRVNVPIPSSVFTKR